MERPIPFIGRVRLRNYKSIETCDVQLGPLTVLVGPNGSGKSNFLDALAFLGRALETTPDQAIAERGGIGEILRRVPAPVDSFSIDVEVSIAWSLAPDPVLACRYGIEVGREPESSHFWIAREFCEMGAGEGGFVANHGLVRTGPSEEVSARIEPDRLYLPFVSARLPEPGAAPAPFPALFRRLSRMHFYRLSLDELRRPQPKAADGVIGSRGEHLGDVLGQLAEEHPASKERLDAYVRAVVPDVAGIDHWFAGRYVTVGLRAHTGLHGREVIFDSLAMSDGTIHAIGVLAALFQPAVIEGQIPLIGIEEPELALHPGAAGVLFDALTEASESVQVLATTQSPDLLDREDLDVSIIRAVSMEEGLTVIGEVDEPSRRIAEDKLYTLGELMRGKQISPQRPPGGDPVQLRV